MTFSGQHRKFGQHSGPQSTLSLELIPFFANEKQWAHGTKSARHSPNQLSLSKVNKQVKSASKLLIDWVRIH